VPLEGSLYSCPPWGCPACNSRLIERVSNGKQRELVCDGCGQLFPFEKGLPILIPEALRASALAAGWDFGAAWRRMGWIPADTRRLLRLPYVSVGQPHWVEWRQKARSAQAVLRLLRAQRAESVADLGAGVGWLSYRLAMAGFRAYAVDSCLDDVVGLGAVGRFLAKGPPFGAAVGLLEHPPFARASLDAAICNAALHYVSRIDWALEAVSRCLKPDGVLYILNSPVHEDANSARRAEEGFRHRLRQAGAKGAWVEQYAHFVSGEFESQLRRYFQGVRRVDVDQGLCLTISRRLKSVLLNLELASFPLYACVQTV